MILLHYNYIFFSCFSLVYFISVSIKIRRLSYGLFLKTYSFITVTLFNHDFVNALDVRISYQSQIKRHGGFDGEILELVSMINDRPKQIFLSTHAVPKSVNDKKKHQV